MSEVKTNRLSDKMLKHYEGILLEEKRQTLLTVRNLIDRQRGSSNSVQEDELSMLNADREHIARLLEEEQKKLKLINQALRRIADKTYGVCLITGNLIGEERLKAVPYAKYSVAAKAAEEKRQAHR